MAAIIGGSSRIKPLDLFSPKQLSPRLRAKTRVTTRVAMEVFFAEPDTHYPVSSLPRPIPEAKALTSLRFWGMGWRRVCPTFITHRRSVAGTKRRLTGEQGWNLPPSITSSKSSGRIFAITFFDRNSQAVFSRKIAFLSQGSTLRSELRCSWSGISLVENCLRFLPTDLCSAKT